MTKVRAAILLFLSLSSALSVFWGFALERAARGIIVDFKVVFIGTRCLVEGHDPYNESQVMSVYLEEGGSPPAGPAEFSRVRQVVALLVYFPTAFLYVAPFALLPFSAAHVIWSGLTVVVFTLSAFLMWMLAQDRAPNAAFYLAAFVLANSGILYAGGNPAGLSIGLCLIATWCFFQEKHVYFAVACLAISLGLKPHDTGFVWLYFLLAGGLLRKRALQTLALTVLLGVPAILWTYRFSPHWMRELSGNLAATSVPGGITDPGPGAMSGSGGGVIIDLQAVVSVFRNDPRFYNSITFAIVGLLLLIWGAVALRAKRTPSNHYLALAAVSALSLLPVYHRPHDAKLLLLTLPACAMLLGQGGVIGRIALFLDSVAIVLTSDLPLAMLAQSTRGMHLSTENLQAKLLTITLGRPVPIVLLALGVFYLWVYARQSFREEISSTSEAVP